MILDSSKRAMSIARRNIVSNLLAGVWITVLTLVITPLQVRLLGMEAYGLIGFIATLQIIFTMFDSGLSSTVTRQIASDRSAGFGDTQALLRTASTIYWGFAVLLGAILAGLSAFIANHWFNTNTLSPEDVKHGLYAITFYLAARWPAALYSGVLSGLQRIDVLNIVKTSTTSLRLAGGIGVLMLWPDLHVFLWWTALNAAAELVAYVVACRLVGAPLSLGFGFSMAAVKAVWGFSLSVSAISMLALAISQLDRVMLSKLLALDDLGHYMLAYNTAAAVSLGISAISSAMLPSFAAAHSQGVPEVLSRRYDYANRVLLCVIGLAVFPLVFFGDVILSLWVGNDASVGASRPLALLALGFWFSGALSNAYSIAVATGHPGLPLRLSALSAIPYAGALYALILLWGTNGAALAWMLLNAVYLIFLVPAVHCRLLAVSTRQWALGTVLPFALLGLASFGIARLAVNYFPSMHLTGIVAAFCVAMTAYCAVGYRLLGPGIQAELIRSLRIKAKATAPLRLHS